MKFYTPKGVLKFWFDYGYAFKNYSIPAVFVSEQENIPPPFIAPENCDYPEWWYAWLDIDSIIKRLTAHEHRILLYYFKNIYNATKGTFFKWKDEQLFRALCEKLWRMVPVEYRAERETGYRDFDRAYKTLQNRVERGSIDMSKIDPEKLYFPEEVAEIFRYTRDTIYKMLNDGRLKGFKVGRKWRITGQSLKEIIEGGSNDDPK